MKLLNDATLPEMRLIPSEWLRHAPILTLGKRECLWMVVITFIKKEWGLYASGQESQEVFSRETIKTTSQKGIKLRSYYPKRHVTMFRADLPFHYHFMAY